MDCRQIVAVEQIQQNSVRYCQSEKPLIVQVAASTNALRDEQIALPLQPLSGNSSAVPSKETDSQWIWRVGGDPQGLLYNSHYSPTVDPGDGSLALHRLGHIWQQFQVGVPWRSCGHRENEPWWALLPASRRMHAEHTEDTVLSNTVKRSWVTAELSISGGEERSPRWGSVRFFLYLSPDGFTEVV